MSRSLVVIEDPDRDRPLLERAHEFAVGAGTDIVVLVLASPEAYEELASTLDTIGKAEHTSYDEADILEGLSGDIDEMAADVLGPDVDYDLRTSVVDPDKQASTVLEYADEAGSDHVFIPGRRRSPTGKAVFGDRTQRVMLNFDGYVTVEMN